MREFADLALNVAQLRGATYADIRIEERTTQSISTKNGVVDALALDESCGFGVRALVDGAWGFAASADLSSTEVERIAALAVVIGRASALAKRRDVRLGPETI